MAQENGPIRRDLGYKAQVEYQQRFQFAQLFVRKYYGAERVMGSLFEEAVRAKKNFFEWKETQRQFVAPDQREAFDTTSLVFVTNFATIQKNLARQEKGKWPEDSEERYKLHKQEAVWHTLGVIFRTAITVNLDEFPEE